MRRLALALFLLFLLVITAPLSAQCDLRATRFDSPVSYGQFAGWNMPRYGWHAFNAGTAIVYVEAIHRTTRLSRRKSAVAVPLVSILAHVVGWRLGHYGVDWRDWLFDAGVRTLPLVLSSSDRPLAITSYTMFYAAAACSGSP